MSRFSVLLALRYLKPKSSASFVITLITLSGVCIGVAVLIAVISVMKGFELRIKSSFFNFDPHLYAGQMAPNPPGRSVDLAKVRQLLMEQPEIVSVYPNIRGMALMEVFDAQEPVQMVGVDPGDPVFAEKIQGFMAKDGEGKPTPFTLQADSGDRVKGEEGLEEREETEGAVISSDLADLFGIGPGSLITLYSTDNLREVLKEMKKRKDAGESNEGLDELILPHELVVTGVFNNLQHPRHILVPDYIARELLNLDEGKLPEFAIDLKDPFAADAVKFRLADAGFLPRNWGLSSWGDANAKWFEAIMGERGMMFFVLFIISLVAAFSVVNTMIVVTVQKRHDIGVLTALGARPGQVLQTFLLQGVIVAFIGVAAGYLAGVALIHWRQHIIDFLSFILNRELLSPAMYGEGGIPAVLDWRDSVTICSIAFVTCVLGALVPAWMASRADPARALRGA